MSARRSSHSPFEPCDVIAGGSICLYRNEQNRPFGDDDQHILTETWAMPSDIPDAYTRLEAAERRLAAEHVFAWHPEFGYLSPFPEHCGTGLHVWAEFHLEGLHLIGDLSPVRAGLDVCAAARQGVVHALLQDQRLATGDYHELPCSQCLLAGCDLDAEVIYGILSLLDLGAEKRVLLESALVLYYHGRNADALEGADVIHEVFCKTACVAVEDDGLGRDLHDVVNGTEAGRHVDKFDVRLALRGGVA